MLFRSYLLDGRHPLPYLNVADSEASSKLRTGEVEGSECHPSSELAVLKKRRGVARLCRLDLKELHTAVCRISLVHQDDG